MRNLFVFLVLSVFHPILHAQDFKIQVIDDTSAPIPYVYVYINSLGVAVTDDNGEALLSKSKISMNDTLTVTFLGMNPGKVVCSSALLNEGKYKFVLKENPLEADEVVIVGDARKSFRKYVNVSRSIDYNCVMSAGFNVRKETPDGELVVADGTLSVRNEVSSRSFDFFLQHGWFHHPAKYTTTSDIEPIRESLNTRLKFLLNWTNELIKGCIQKQLTVNDSKPRYSYLGVDGNNRVFRISYNDQINKITLQIIIYVDKKTKDLSRMQVECLNDIRNTVWKIDGSFYTYIHKKPPMAAVLVPNRLSLDYFDPKEGRMVIEINDATIKKE